MISNNKRIILNALRMDLGPSADEIDRSGELLKEFGNWDASSHKYRGKYYLIVGENEVYGPFNSESEVSSKWREVK